MRRDQIMQMQDDPDGKAGHNKRADLMKIHNDQKKKCRDGTGHRFENIMVERVVRP